MVTMEFGKNITYGSVNSTYASVMCTELELNVYLALDIRYVSMLLVAT